MTQSDSSELRPEDGTHRFRRIRTTPEEEEILPPASTPDPQTDSNPAAGAAAAADSTASNLPPLERLQATQKKAGAFVEAQPAQAPSASGSRRSLNPFGRKKEQRANEDAPVPAREARTAEPASPSRKLRLAPAFWTIASTLSLMVNLILIIVLLFLLNYVSQLNLQINQLLEYAKLPQETVQGLYDNFVLMDDAHIRTQIPVSLVVPVKFDITINTQTDVILTQDTTINQARVTLTTGGLNISNAPANIILPAGTRLPVSLSLVVPVDQTVPVSLIVPVDIALKDTDLHTPFLGLQQVIQPLYCLLDPQATSKAGLMICEQPQTP